MGPKVERSSKKPIGAMSHESEQKSRGSGQNDRSAPRYTTHYSFAKTWQCVCRVGRAPPRGGVQADTACGGGQAGAACCAPRDLLRAWQCRGTACRARSSRSSTWLLNIRSRTDETDRSTTDGWHRGFGGRHRGFKFHPLLRQTLDPCAVVLDGSSHMLSCKKDFWL